MHARYEWVVSQCGSAVCILRVTTARRVRPHQGPVPVYRTNNTACVFRTFRPSGSKRARRHPDGPRRRRRRCARARGMHLRAPSQASCLIIRSRRLVGTRMVRHEAWNKREVLSTRLQTTLHASQSGRSILQPAYALSRSASTSGAATAAASSASAPLDLPVLPSVEIDLRNQGFAARRVDPRDIIEAEVVQVRPRGRAWQSSNVAVEDIDSDDEESLASALGAARQAYAISLH